MLLASFAMFAVMPVSAEDDGEKVDRKRVISSVSRCLMGRYVESMNTRPKRARGVSKCVTPA